MIKTIQNKSIKSLGKRFVRVWADTSKRSSSLNVAEDIKSSLFNEITPENGNGAASIPDYESKLRYHSPIGIHEAFEESYKILSEDANVKYQQLEKETDPKKIENLQIEAEQYNPEVLYNAEFNHDSLNKTQPIYRQLLQKKWQDKDLMILMQRLETMHVIPDTLPTLNPTADVKIKFNHNTDPRFIGWIEPGTKLPAFAVSQPPTIQINDFENKNQDELYTVLLVNPDVPDLHANTYQTNLHYGLVNISLNNINDTIKPQWLLNNEDCIIQDYLPLTPFKNLPYQRACLWVFKQNGRSEVTKKSIKSRSFDIGKFVTQNNLNPIGAHLWRQEFDRSVNSIREMYGLPKGEVFLKFRHDEPINTEFLRIELPYKFNNENRHKYEKQASEIEAVAEKEHNESESN
ncbi:unnamed protein product [Candida verbasci]|uniref:Large ribosomal subunit protein mL38 n=1 Tax=Candida verbasci TaxID=1227364 RepID=A0A9W4XK07_9ASCO|nr:unnamed protein product [Candida verbasci]